MESKNEKIWDSLKKHFDAVGCLTSREGVTTFYCSLGTVSYNFPFYEEDIDSHNPQDVVNAIWEYITKYML